MKSNIILVLSLLFSTLVFTQEKTIKDYNLPDNLVAVKGYDVVAYFDDAATEGDKTIKSSIDGVKYYFSSQKNKELFDKNPQKYIPKYGGWCAYAMARGDMVKVNPEAYLIQNDSLYLFYRFGFSDTLSKWKENPSSYQSKADKNWND